MPFTLVLWLPRLIWIFTSTPAPIDINEVLVFIVASCHYFSLNQYFSFGCNFKAWTAGVREEKLVELLILYLRYFNQVCICFGFGFVEIGEVVITDFYFVFEFEFTFLTVYFFVPEESENFDPSGWNED